MLNCGPVVEKDGKAQSPTSEANQNAKLTGWQLEHKHLDRQGLSWNVRL
jgi:hypothetical protein